MQQLGELELWAGVGNDTREDRYFNVVGQGKRYDPGGEYVSLWIPELKDVPENQRHEPRRYNPGFGY